MNLFFKISLILVAILFCEIKESFAQVDKSIDKSSFTTDTAYFNYLIVEARKYNGDMATIERARLLINEAEKLIAEKKIVATPLFYIVRAEFYLTLRNFLKASEQISAINENFDKKSIDIYTSIQYNHLTAYYSYYVGYFSEALSIFSKNISNADEYSLTGVYPAAYEGLAKVYAALDNLSEEKKCVEKMLSFALAENDNKFIFKAYIRKGLILRTYEKDYQEAQKCFTTGLGIARILKDTVLAIDATKALAWNYYLKNDLDSSLVLFNEMLSLSIASNNQSQIANAIGNFGTIYRDKKEYDKAIDYYLKSIDIAYKVRSWDNLAWIYRDCSQLYETINDFKNAYKYQILYKQYSDSVNSSNYITSNAVGRIRYQAQLKENELQALALKYKNQRYLMYGFVIFSVLIAVIGYLVFRQSKNNAKRRILEMNQKILEISQANLRQQMNPHFVFNTLNSIQYYMYQNDKLSTNNYLTKFSDLMRKILENSQHTTISIADELNAVQLYIELELLRFKNKFDFQIVVDDDIDTLMYKVPSMLIQPYVENAICHGLMNREDKGFLKIHLGIEQHYISCLIVDNGIGREAAQEIKKKREKTHQPLGTKITESRIDLINLLYGSSLKIIYVDLKDNVGNPAGTSVEIQIPILT